MTDTSLLTLEIDEDSKRLGIRELTFDQDLGIVTIPILAPDNTQFTLRPIYRWDRDKDWIENLEGLKTQVIIQVQHEFEDQNSEEDQNRKQKLGAILSRLHSVLSENQDVILTLAAKLGTQILPQSEFKFEFQIPEGLKSQDIDLALKGELVQVRIKDQVIICRIKNEVQAVLEDFTSKYTELGLDVDLCGRISICLSENLARFMTEKEVWEQQHQVPTLQAPEERSIDIAELEAIPDKQYDDYVIATIQKTVKLEPRLTRQIFITAASTYTPNPINLGIIAPTSEGKTHPVVETLEYFPNPDVWYIGGMSPKTLIRLNGFLVDSNNNPIGDKVKELRKNIALTKNSVAENIQYREQLDSLLEKSKTVIDFFGKILVFLEPPDIKLWEVIKPILSHDKREIEYPFVNATDKDGIETKKVVVRGWPACIFCSAKDESGWKVWPEIQSRFIITSPNMSKQKYHEANKLIADKKGLPRIVRQRKIISNEEIDLAKKAVLYLKQEIHKTRDAGQDTIWVPYQGVLGEIFPSSRGTDMRSLDRILSIINVNSFVKAHARPKLMIGEETDIVATLEDLHLALALTQSNGIPPYKMQFFDEIFYPRYKIAETTGPNSTDEKIESRIGITTKQLAEYYKEQTGKIITTDSVRERFLDELLNNTIIDREESNIHRRQFIYYPLVSPKSNGETTKDAGETIKLTTSSPRLSHLVQNLQFSPIKPPNNYTGVASNWLELQILDVKRYQFQNEQIKFFNTSGDEITLIEFVEEFEKSEKLNRYVEKAEYCNSHKQSNEEPENITINPNEICKKTQGSVQTGQNVLRIDSFATGES